MLSKNALKCVTQTLIHYGPNQPKLLPNRDLGRNFQTKGGNFYESMSKRLRDSFVQTSVYIIWCFYITQLSNIRNPFYISKENKTKLTSENIRTLKDKVKSLKLFEKWQLFQVLCLEDLSEQRLWTSHPCRCKAKELLTICQMQ